MENDDTIANKVVDYDDPKCFEKILEVIETSQEKYCVSVTNIKDLNQILILWFTYLMSKYDLSPNELVIVTATENEKKSVKNEINRALSVHRSLLDDYLLTLHAFCLKFINDNRDILGYKNEFTWMSNGRKRTITREICKKIGISKDEELFKNITTITDLQKAEDLTIEEALKRAWSQKDCAAFRDKIEKFNDEYKRRCRESGELDFNDMLVCARDALKLPSDIKLNFPKKIVFNISGQTNKLWKEVVTLFAQRSENFFAVYLDSKSHRHGDESIEKSHDYTDFFNSIKNLIPTTNWFSSSKGNGFKNSLFKNFLQQRYSKDFLEKIERVKSSTKNQEIGNFVKGRRKEKINSWSASKKLFKEKLIEIGCDEVGVGDYFGGIVTAAVVLQSEQLDKLPWNLIKNVKSLTKEQVYDCYEKLKELVQFSVVEFNPNKYNQLYDVYRNANKVKTCAYNDVLANLISERKIELENTRIIIDRFVKPTWYERYLNEINSKQTIKIDRFENRAAAKYLSVALAWIFARHCFLEQIKWIQDQTKIPEIPLGSSDPNVKSCAEKIHEWYGIEKLKNCVKFHFKFTKSVKQMNPTKND